MLIVVMRFATARPMVAALQMHIQTVAEWRMSLGMRACLPHLLAA
jgi:hypothetical protein